MINGNRLKMYSLSVKENLKLKHERKNVVDRNSTKAESSIYMKIPRLS